MIRKTSVIEAVVKRPHGAVLQCDKRFRILVAGRRFGKTQLALLELFAKICQRDRLAWYVAPTYRQAKRIAWARLKDLVRAYRPSRIYETELRIDFGWGSSIALRGADNYDSLRGEGLDFLVLDEFADIAPQAWTEVLRPMLSDRQGRALFIGTPKGRNHFYELYQKAKDGTPGWAAFSYTTLQGGYVAREEIEAAKQELDERTFRQEYEASFESFSGGAYYAFERNENVKTTKYNPRLPLLWALDFNVNPMCSVICQRDAEDNIHVLQELVLPESNTYEACEEFVKRCENYYHPSTQLNLYVYGDACGESRHSSASRTDWQIVKEFLGRYPHLFKFGFRRGDANPPVKDRVTCVNSRLRCYAGDRRIFIDPRCKELIKDLEQVTWKTDAAGNWISELSKNDPLRTHVSDALGYLVYREFPMRPKMGEMPGSLGIH